jgi:hypothetical protein
MKYQIRIILSVQSGPISATLCLAPSLEGAKEWIESRFGSIILIEEDQEHPDHFDAFTDSCNCIAIEPYREKIPIVPRTI